MNWTERIFLALVFGAGIGALAVFFAWSGQKSGDFFRERRAKKDHEKQIMAAQRWLKTSVIKADIPHVGELIVMERHPTAPSIHIDGWAFKTRYGLIHRMQSPVFGCIYMGYSAQELVEIHARKAEFEQPEL